MSQASELSALVGPGLIGAARFAVIGYPIEHSLSPDIHVNFARQRNFHIDYTRIECEPRDFVETIDRFMDIGGVALNVTTPFKDKAYELCNELTEQARTARTVNSLRLLSKGKFIGHNTDGLGLCRDLQENLSLNLAESRILILGAGATARAVVPELMQYQPRGITVFNRTQTKLNAFIEFCRKAGAYAAENNIEAFEASQDSQQDNQYDLIVNCASTALGDGEAVMPELGQQPESCLAYDLSYGLGRTEFLSRAEEKWGCYVCDGIGMLVEQAAYSFVWWHDEPMPLTHDLIKQLSRLYSQYPR